MESVYRKIAMVFNGLCFFAGFLMVNFEQRNWLSHDSLISSIFFFCGGVCFLLQLRSEIVQSEYRVLLPAKSRVTPLVQFIFDSTELICETLVFACFLLLAMKTLFPSVNHTTADIIYRINAMYGAYVKNIKMALVVLFGLLVLLDMLSVKKFKSAVKYLKLLLKPMKVITLLALFLHPYKGKDSGNVSIQYSAPKTDSQLSLEEQESAKRVKAFEAYQQKEQSLQKNIYLYVNAVIRPPEPQMSSENILSRKELIRVYQETQNEIAQEEINHPSQEYSSVQNGKRKTYTDEIECASPHSAIAPPDINKISLENLNNLTVALEESAKNAPPPDEFTSVLRDVFKELLRTQVLGKATEQVDLYPFIKSPIVDKLSEKIADGFFKLLQKGKISKNDIVNALALQRKKLNGLKKCQEHVDKKFTELFAEKASIYTKQRQFLVDYEDMLRYPSQKKLNALTKQYPSYCEVKELNKVVCDYKDRIAKLEPFEMTEEGQAFEELRRKHMLLKSTKHTDESNSPTELVIPPDVRRNMHRMTEKDIEQKFAQLSDKSYDPHEWVVPGVVRDFVRHKARNRNSNLTKYDLALSQVVQNAQNEFIHEERLREIKMDMDLATFGLYPDRKTGTYQRPREHKVAKAKGKLESYLHLPKWVRKIHR